jgi:hypothetical protein
MSIWDSLRALLGFGNRPQGAPTGSGGGSSPAGFPDSPDEPAQITNPKVLLLICDPVVDAASGERLAEHMGWARPDGLVNAFIGDILQMSGGLARYQIVQRELLDEFPALVDGFRYSPQAYLDVMSRHQSPHNPQGIDYQALVEHYDILGRVARRQIDEVWMMAFPYAGLFESAMGGAGAFWCNGPPLANTESCPRRFVVMGFSYEREVGEMLHSFNHRCESILAHVFDCLDFLAWTYRTDRVPPTVRADQQLNLFQRYLLYDQIAPGRAAIGTVHYAPNASRDYDLGNRRPVQSECYDWLHFPNFQGDVRTVTASEWGGGTEKDYQRWWLQHLPKVAGRQHGIHNNWWQYITNLENVAV